MTTTFYKIRDKDLKFDTSLIAVAESMNTGNFSLHKPEQIANMLQADKKIYFMEILHRCHNKFKFFIDVEKEIIFDDTDDFEPDESETRADMLKIINEIAKKMKCKVHVAECSRRKTEVIKESTNDDNLKVLKLEEKQAEKNERSVTVYKFSFHAIYEKYFPTMPHIQQWLYDNGYGTGKLPKESAEEKLQRLSNTKVKKKDFFDGSVYSENHKFRMVNCGKTLQDAEPFKIISKGSMPIDFIITDESRAYETEAIELNGKIKDEVTKKQKSQRKWTSAQTKIGLEQFADKFPGYVPIYKYGSSLIGLHRNDPNASCPVCKRVHSADHNMFWAVIKSNGDIVFKCWKDTKQCEIIGKMNFEGYISHIPFEKMECNSDDLSKTLSHSISKKFILIHSGTGTGKSKWAYEEIKIYDSCIDIVSRVSLSKEHKNALPDFKDYNKIKGTIVDDNVIICINSLLRTCNEYECVVLDEINSIIKHLLGRTIKDMQAIFVKLLQIVRRAKRVIMLDADVTQLTIEFIKALTSVDNVLYVNNSYIRPRASICNYYIGKKKNDTSVEEAKKGTVLNAWWNELGKKVEEKKKLYICTDAKSTAEKIYRYVKQIDKSADAVLYTAEEGDLDEFVIKNFHAITIVSPRVTYGVSIEKDSFDFVFGHYCGLSIDVQECLQQITRYRIDKPCYIYHRQYNKVPRFYTFVHAYDYFSRMIKITGKYANKFNIDVQQYDDISTEPELVMRKDIFNKLRIYEKLFEEKSKTCPHELLKENLKNQKAFNINLITEGTEKMKFQSEYFVARKKPAKMTAEFVAKMKEHFETRKNDKEINEIKYEEHTTNKDEKKGAKRTEFETFMNKNADFLKMFGSFQVDACDVEYLLKILQHKQSIIIKILAKLGQMRITDVGTEMELMKQVGYRYGILRELASSIGKKFMGAKKPEKQAKSIDKMYFIEVAGSLLTKEQQEKFKEITDYKKSCKYVLQCIEHKIHSDLCMIDKIKKRRMVNGKRTQVTIEEFSEEKEKKLFRMFGIKKIIKNLKK